MSLEKITPTLTLAKLYESQKQYFDAFTIYSKINIKNPSEDISDRIKALEEKIFTENQLSYNTLISKIFSEEDKKKFKLLPEDNYLKYRNRMDDEDEEDETVEFVKEDFEENENDMTDAEEIEVRYFEEEPIQMEIPESIIKKVNAQNTDHGVNTPKNNPIFNTEFDSLLIDITNIKTQVIKSQKTSEIELLNLTVSEFAQFIINKINKDKRLAELTLLEIKEIRRILKEVLI